MKSAKIIAVAAALGVMSVSAFATTVGYVSKSIPAGSTDSFAISFDTVPGTFTGASTGTFTATPTATTLTNASAGWAVNFPTTADPYFLKITSGTAEGRYFQISTNTATVLTVTGGPLAAGVANGDSYQIINAQTLSEFFALSTLSKGATRTDVAADNIYLFSAGTWIGYVPINTGVWQTLTGPTSDRSNVVIRPDSGMFFVSRGITSTMITSGVAPASDGSIVVNNGTNWVPTTFPVDMTLNNLYFENLATWQNSVEAGSRAAADAVYVLASGAWTGYVHNGTTGWTRVTGPTTLQNPTIPAGTAMFVEKKSAGNEVLTVVKPY